MSREPPRIIRAMRDGNVSAAAKTAGIDRKNPIGLDIGEVTFWQR